MKASKRKGSNVNNDLLKMVKKMARDNWGFSPNKTTKNKKKYNRKTFKKINNNDFE